MKVKNLHKYDQQLCGQLGLLESHYETDDWVIWNV